MHNLYKYCILFVALMLLPTTSRSAECPQGYTCSKTLTMFGQAENNPVDHYDYADINAPKGGTIRYAVIGTYDNLNPFILKGVSAAGIGSIYDTLMTDGNDDIFTRYGLIAESVKVADDKKSIIFVLNPKAKWHDGQPITADDVVWTFNTLIEKGNPIYKAYYKDVEKVEALNPQEVKFSFKTADNRELPFILSELAILPKHYYKDREFNKVSIEAPLGSGAYKVDKVNPGRSISFKRVPDYWAATTIPYLRGLDNFDIVNYDYYRDETVAVEALKAGQYDIRQENVARIWETAYNTPAVQQGKLIKQEIKHQSPTGMQSFTLNLRREKFQDVRVRKALNLAFDFEWSNKTLFYNSYTRTRSYFSNSIYEAKGLPEDRELEILNQYKGKIPDEVFTTEYNPPVTDGSGNNRKNLVEAKNLLKEAGWEIKNGMLTNAKGEIFTMEFLLTSAVYERVIEPYIANLKKLGIQATMRTVDTSQYIKRAEEFDFDAVMHVFGAGSVPGNELTDMFNSKQADIQGSNNIAGIKNEVVDSLIEQVIKAQTKEELISTVKALDRVLQHNYYVIPNWNITKFRLIYWDKFGHPDKSPKYSVGLNSWWSKEAEKFSEPKDKTSSPTK